MGPLGLMVYYLEFTLHKQRPLFVGCTGDGLGVDLYVGQILAYFQSYLEVVKASFFEVKSPNLLVISDPKSLMPIKSRISGDTFPPEHDQKHNFGQLFGSTKSFSLFVGRLGIIYF